MSAKMQFLTKLQARKEPLRGSKNRNQADIAEFSLRMEQLQEQFSGWLTGTGVTPELSDVLLSDLLVEGRVFKVPGISLCYENRMIKFTPLFLYAQGVTGGVEVSLHAESTVTMLGRLFMRAGHVKHWTFTQQNGAVCTFDEEVFFEVIAGLLP